MDKEKIKQKIKELEALLGEPEDKDITNFNLKLNTGEWRYLGDDFFSRFATPKQSEIAAKRRWAQNELLQMAFILNIDWKPNFADSSEKKYYVYFDHEAKIFGSICSWSWASGVVYFKDEPLKYFLATASDNLKAYIKGELP